MNSEDKSFILYMAIAFIFIVTMCGIGLLAQVHEDRMEQQKYELCVEAGKSYRDGACK